MLQTLKKHPALIPLIFCLSAGVTGSFLYTMRLAFRNPDVTWSQKRNPEPWNEYKNKQYKFVRLQADAESMKSPAPEY